MLKIGSGKSVSSIVTILVIGLLVFAGPVDALHLGLSGFKTTPYAFGESINFLGEIEINSNEIVNLQNVSVEVNDEIVCTFDVLGNKLTACDGINVSLVSNTANHGYGYGYNSFEKGWNGGNSSSKAGNWTGYSYGYGYGYSGAGELVYNVTMQTPQSYLHIPGDNDIKLVSQTETQTFNSRIEKIVIRPQNSGGGRGSGGGGPSGEEEGRRNDNLGQGNENNNLNEFLANLGSNQDGQNANSPITGAVVGKEGKVGLWSLAVIGLFLAIIGVSSLIVYKKRRKFEYNPMY